MNMITLTILIVAGGFVACLLGILSGNAYDDERVDNESDDYAGTIKESRGPVSVFLWVSYAAIAVFTIAYLVMHWGEFLAIG